MPKKIVIGNHRTKEIISLERPKTAGKITKKDKRNKEKLSIVGRSMTVYSLMAARLVLINPKIPIMVSVNAISVSFVSGLCFQLRYELPITIMPAENRIQKVVYLLF